jgi:predicted signal transduction protein with EAL and GGDEF domain
MTEQIDSPQRIFSDSEMRHLLTREVQRCTRYQDFLSLCLVTASYPGAPVPEMELAITRRIAAMLRTTDIVGVIGDDIAVLLVHTPDVDAGLIADRIRARIQGDDVEAPRELTGPGRVTLSIGLASFPSDATGDDRLLAHAQAQLQSAQRAARPAP